MTNKLYEILVPCVSNEGKPFKTKQHREWDRRILRISEGLTILKPVKGKWSFENTNYHERMIPVRICY